jgi:serine/threonine protein kinase
MLPTFLRSFKTEIETMKRLDHPSIVKMVGYTLTDKEAIIYMDLFDYSLRKLLDKMTPVPAPQMYDIVTQILKGLQYLHSNNIAHRDLKVMCRVCC